MFISTIENLAVPSAVSILPSQKQQKQLITKYLFLLVSSIIAKVEDWLSSVLVASWQAIYDRAQFENV